MWKLQKKFDFALHRWGSGRVRVTVEYTEDDNAFQSQLKSVKMDQIHAFLL